MEIKSILRKIDSLKHQLDKSRPLISSQIKDSLDIEYTYESNRIEGNTISLRETDLIVNKGLTISGKSLQEHLETTNHYEAIHYISELVEDKVELSEAIVKQIHAIILQGIDRKHAGVYRVVPVKISGSRHTPPQPIEVNNLMKDMFSWYDNNKEKLHTVVVAAEMHERLATIHPFVDGNGRTARLLMNLILMQKGYPIVNIPGDSESRLSYYNALEKCNTEENKSDFIKQIAEQELKSITKLCKLLNIKQKKGMKL